MFSPLNDEIRGDWNNLKGTEYHLVYVLWLLLCRNISSVAFYRGNDLLANPTFPPMLEKTAFVSVIHTSITDKDEWIQLKATRDPWTVRVLLEDNLLLNFICNALSSEATGRTWRMRLVTQGEIRRGAIEKFVDHPEHFQDLYDKLKEILYTTQNRLRQDGWQLVDQARLQTLALAILRQIAQEKPFL